MQHKCWTLDTTRTWLYNNNYTAVVNFISMMYTCLMHDAIYMLADRYYQTRVHAAGIGNQVGCHYVYVISLWLLYNAFCFNCKQLIQL